MLDPSRRRRPLSVSLSLSHLRVNLALLLVLCYIIGRALYTNTGQYTNATMQWPNGVGGGV